MSNTDTPSNSTPLSEEQISLQWLSSLLDSLRQGCSWDRVQTIESLRHLTIEEVHELSSAIISGNYEEIKKELGDILMHVVFYSKIANDLKQFSLSDVIDGICAKLIARHPHLSLPLRDGSLTKPAQTNAPQWEQVKMKEGRRSVFDGVPDSLPSAIKAQRLQDKAAGMGFEYRTNDQAIAKIEEELTEVKEALTSNTAHNNANIKEELGDLLFAVTSLCRMNGINADEALERCNRKFIARFQFIEQKANERGIPVASLAPDEMLTLWNEAKSKQPSSL